MSAPATTQELLERIERLEQTLLADQLQPGVFSINSRGEVVETVGQLHANGIVLPLGFIAKVLPGPGTSQLNELIWNIEETGEAAASIVAFNFDHLITHNRQLVATTTYFGNVATLNLTASKEAGAATSAALEATAHERTPAAVFALSGETSSVKAQIGASNLTIIDQAGLSNFLQLLAAGNHKVAFGTTTVKWGAKGFQSEQREVATGLTTITAAFAMPLVGAGLGPQFVAGCATKGAALELSARCNTAEQALGTEIFVSWLAIE